MQICAVTNDQLLIGARVLAAPTKPCHFMRGKDRRMISRLQSMNRILWSWESGVRQPQMEAII